VTVFCMRLRRYSTTVGYIPWGWRNTVGEHADGS
jgi:hypothetical protein